VSVLLWVTFYYRLRHVTSGRGTSRNLVALKAEVDEKNGILQSLRRSLAESDEKLARRSQQCRQLMDIVSVRRLKLDRQPLFSFVSFYLILAASNFVTGAREAHEFD
jgi:hypothetical protein